jgi:hypothetical protein
MSRKTLRLFIVTLSVVIAVLAASALDRLPSSVRAQIDSERAALNSARSQLHMERDQVAAQAKSDAALFGAIPFGGAWPGRLDQAAFGLDSAGRDMDELTRLERHNRHSDAARAQSVLMSERNLRTRALSDAGAVQKEAAHWVDAKNHLAEHVQEMESAHHAIDAFDLTPVSAAVAHAEADWPAKKPDLDARLDAERGIVANSDKFWQSTAEDRRKAAGGDLSGVNTGALLAAAETVTTSAADQARQAGELQSLTGQLYTSWDKLLVDMQARGEGNAREYDQKIRTVRTHITNAAAKTGDTQSDEQWVIVMRPTYDAMRGDLGMAIEHKSAGLYDSEAEHVAQPAGMAYVAPPGQGSNQYGYWDHRDGRDFWVFYGQYALLRDLLSNHDYRPYDRYEYEGYRTQQSRGQTYYGHDSGSDAPKYGSQGTTTQNRYSGSKYAQSGGFRDSQYASKSGGYRDSQYASPSMREPGVDHSPRSFGHNSSPSSPAPRAAPAPRSYRPSPAPSRAPMRSPGRSFGRHK